MKDLNIQHCAVSYVLQSSFHINNLKTVFNVCYLTLHFRLHTECGNECKPICVKGKCLIHLPSKVCDHRSQMKKAFLYIQSIANEPIVYIIAMKDCNIQRCAVSNV